VAHIDVRKYTQKAQEYGVDALPTSFFFVEGNPVKRIKGYRDYETLKTEAENVLQPPTE
jgi:thioredoxin-like negative regulator of GroEL